MRIASLLPSATDIVCALGLGDELVGVSHECDYPPEVVDRLPQLNRSALPPNLTSAQIDVAVADLMRRGESVYLLEEKLLAELKPDLLITQALCDVCAVSFDEVCRISARLPGDPQVVSLQPANLEGILADILTVAEAAHCLERGERLVAELRARLERVVETVPGRPRPRVFALEWLDPPFAAGHWVPEMIALAGGEEVLGRPGKKSFRVKWEEIIAAQPEVILLIPCGYSPATIEPEFSALPKPPGWESIPAVRSGRIYPLDANSYFSRPGPRVVEGVEQLAALFNLEA